MNTLVIDNTQSRDSWGCADLASHCAHASRGVVQVRRAPAQDLPPNPQAFDAVVLSGSITSTHDQSPWVKNLDRWVSDYLKFKRPFLGICYGHQTLARVLGGIQCVKDQSTAEFGWTQIEIVNPSPLFTGLKNPFTTFSWHRDEVIQLPPGTKLLARSKLSGIQAFQWGELPVFGIQFHPEKSLASAESSLHGRVQDKKTKGLLHANDSKKLFDASVGETVFNNFFGLTQS